MGGGFRYLGVPPPPGVDKLTNWNYYLPLILRMWSVITLIICRVNIETCNKNQTPLSLDQSSTSTCCWSSWMAIIISIYKSDFHYSQSQHRDLQKKFKMPLNFVQSSTFTCCQPSLIETIIRIHKNDSYHLHSKLRDLQQKPNATKFGSIFNFNILSAILDGSHYKNLQKWLLSLTAST